MGLKIKAKRIIIIWVIIFILLSSVSSGVYAYTVDQCQSALAGYCWNFYNSGAAADTHYYVADWASSTSERAYAYKDQKSPNCTHSTKLGMDCVGWVSYAVHHCYGIGNEEFTYFVTPQNGAVTAYEPVTGQYQPGDILTNYHHVFIYVGDVDGSGKGSIVHCTGSGGPGGPANKTSAGWGVSCDYLDTYTSNPDNAVSGHFRLSESAAASVVNLNTEHTITGIVGSEQSNINYSNFFFNGIPDGKYSLASRKSLLATIIDFLANIIDYLIGILTYIVRIVFVGWTAIFDNLLNWTVQTVVDTGTDPAEAGLSPVEVKNTETEDRKVTIESLLFNKFDLLNINIFE